MELNGKRQLKQFVIMRFVDRLEQFFNSFAAKDSERFLPPINPGRPFEAKEKRGQPGAMIQMQMTDPDCIKVHPVGIFLGHSMRGVRTAIQQNRSYLCLEPVSGRGPMRMWNGCAGTENHELHDERLD